RALRLAQANRHRQRARMLAEEQRALHLHRHFRALREIAEAGAVPQLQAGPCNLHSEVMELLVALPVRREAERVIRAGIGVDAGERGPAVAVQDGLAAGLPGDEGQRSLDLL